MGYLSFLRYVSELEEELKEGDLSLEVQAVIRREMEEILTVAQKVRIIDRFLDCGLTEENFLKEINLHLNLSGSVKKSLTNDL